MGKAGRNESRRTAANFLNGIAVALLMVGYVGPLVAGDSRIWVAHLAIVASATAHFAAVRIAAGIED